MMKPLLIATALVLTSAAASTAAAAAGLSPNEQAQLQQNLHRGLELRRYDQSAWHVTDAALAAMSGEAKRLARGFITTPAPNGLRTTFFGETGGNYFALYSAVWTGSGIEQPQLYAPNQRVPVSAEERRLILARKAALESQSALGICSSAPPNVIVVPAAAGGLVQVYVLTPQTRPDSYPFGGHHRIDVSDGRVVATRAFTKSCIEMSRRDMPPGAQAAGLLITFFMDPVTTEIHVFNAFAARVPVIVGVRSGRIYSVEVSGGRPSARLVQDLESTGR
jgi:hypothetical protein